MAGNALRNALLAGVAVVATGGGLWALQRQPAPSGVVIQTPTTTVIAATATPAVTPTLARILVHVAGAVREPGVYALSPDDRVVDAVAAAGGLTAEADVDQVNLADHLQDAMRLYIPIMGVATPVAPTPIPAAIKVGSKTGGFNSGANGLVNINSATQAELEALPHIGEALAKRIIAHREDNGPFTNIEELDAVAGIGDAIMADLRNLITVQ